MAKRSRGKGPSDSTLRGYWRQAVLIVHGRRCIFCGHFIPEDDPWECHHVVRVRRRVLRWDVKNGVPSHPECHNTVAHTLRGQKILIERHPYMEYLMDRQTLLYKDVLQDTGHTDRSWRERELATLKSIIHSGSYDDE